MDPCIRYGSVRETRLVLDRSRATEGQVGKYPDLNLALYVGLQELLKRDKLSARDPFAVVRNMEPDDVAYVEKVLGVPLRIERVYA